jgi:hypothetical protein
VLLARRTRLVPLALAKLLLVAQFTAQDGVSKEGARAPDCNRVARPMLVEREPSLPTPIVANR